MISRDDLPYWALIGLAIVALFMVAMAKAARANTAPNEAAQSLPFTCDQVRQFVSVATREQIEAISKRMTREQRRLASACLKEKP